MRLVVQEAHRPADHGVAVCGIPAGDLLRRVTEPPADHADQEEVEEPVEHRVLAWVVAADLVVEHRHQRCGPRPSVEDDRLRERSQHPCAELAAQLVAAHEHLGGPVGVVAPGAHPEVEVGGDVPAVGGGAAPAVTADDRRRQVGLAGQGDRVGALGQEHRAGGEEPTVTGVGGGPRRPPDRRDQAERRVVSHADGPRRLHDGAEEERAPPPRGVQQRGQHVHAPSIGGTGVGTASLRVGATARWCHTGESRGRS